MNRLFVVKLILLVGSVAHLAAGTSVYTLHPDDPQAVSVGRAGFEAKGDGVADDTAVLQAAIDRVQETTRRGIVFLPEGRYRLTHELRVWSGIRLIGWGAHRPVLVLGPKTPGYQDGAGKYLVHFVSDRPARPDQPVRDANPGTFYSALSNIDLEIGDGNPAAVGVRSHFAQHCFISHADFHIGSGRAGIEEVGNEAEDLRFEGGDFGITTHKPSPSWPFLLVDSTFSGQRKAAIESEEGGLTLIRDQFDHTPTVIQVRPERAEELWIEDCRFNEIGGPAIEVGEDRNARTQISLRNVACRDVPVLLHLRDGGRTLSGPSRNFRVTELVHGLQLVGAGDANLDVTTTTKLEPNVDAPPVASDLAPLPSMSEWFNVRGAGARGDGEADDTGALRAAIAGHRVIYFPSGRYRVTDTIALRADTVLIGLNPITTQILLTDFTPAFQGENGPTERPAVPKGPAAVRAWLTPPPFPGKGAPKPMVESSPGGTNIINGIGLDCGGINNRAVALKWQAGEHSLVSDVRFLGGHGTYGPDGQWLPIYNDTRTGDADPQRRWDSEFWSLWVTNGGGGVFKDIWTPDTFAAAGLYVSDTTTRGRIYALSSEHHVRNETIFHRASNWKVYALQTEEERGESPCAVPLEIEDCSELTIANFFIYRVEMPVAARAGIRVTQSRRVDLDGLHVYSPGKLSFDNTVVDASAKTELREREVARLQIGGDDPGADRGTKATAVNEPLRKIAGDFDNIDGVATGPEGDVFFVDQTRARIYRYHEPDTLSVVTDGISQPVALAVARNGDLLVVSHHGNVYLLPKGAHEDGVVALEPRPSGPTAGATAWLPLNRWRDGHDWIVATTRREPREYVSPDGSVTIPAPESFPALTKRGRSRGEGTVDLVRTYALGPAVPGRPFYVSDEFGQTTWRFTPAADGVLTAPTRFAEQGEAGTAVDSAGNVYVCAGNVIVYDSSGRRKKVILVPERPSALAFGGKDNGTLFIAARTSLYAVVVRGVGQ
ncbi:MAG TPA: glycosyl hydrolase family 28-related protein [Candidatus Didemnitutus sp.]|nr:glycosyl hydrolase family 28-related protein [Candidatus Didemnitutus sp.]